MNKTQTSLDAYESYLNTLYAPDAALHFGWWIGRYANWGPQPSEARALLEQGLYGTALRRYELASFKWQWRTWLKDPSFRPAH